MSFLDEAIARLVDEGVGALNTSIFATSKQAVPNGAGPYLTIVETGGSGPSWTQNRIGPAYQHPSLAVTGVAKDYSDASDIARAAYDALGTVRNEFIGATWYRSIVPLQEPYDLLPDAQGRARVRFNALADKRPSTGGSPMFTYRLIATLGGEPYAFVAPSAPDVYPSGATFDKLVPGSYPVVFDPDALAAGNYVLEANARLDSAAGARAKLGLFDLSDPDTALVEIEFTVNEVVGERKRSSTFTFSSGPDMTLGVKITTDDAAVGAAAWGCRILKV